MAFTLTQLETFRRLAREENFTRTAEGLHLTQPAVTQQVRALQAHFHVKLVDVARHRTVLTEAGRFLAARAEVVLGDVEAREREMREFADVRAGELRIGATRTIGSYTLPDLVARFGAAHPGIRLLVRVENTEAIARAVKNGHVSLALVEGPLADAELDIVPYAEDELVLIVPKKHALARKRRTIAARDLTNVPFVFREEGSGTRAQAERALLDAGVTPHVALTLPSGEGIVRAVELGIGVAIVSRLIAEGPVRSERVARVRIADLTLPRMFRVIRLARQTPSPAVLAFVALLHAEPAKKIVRNRTHMKRS